jgi:predicted nucleotidyltransferase
MTSRNIEKEILHVFNYFALFSYPPTADELYQFLKISLKKSEFYKLMIQLCKTGRVIERSLDTKRYTLKDHINFFDLFDKRSSIAREKQKIAEKFIRVLRLFPTLKMVGISGSLAMRNTKQEDDIDLFIITEQNRLWTGRIIALVISILMRLKRPRNVTTAKNKVCLNLFFDRQHLVVPSDKQTEYVGHEVLQLVPVLNRSQTYELFLAQNSWVFDVFPNAIQQTDKNNPATQGTELQLRDTLTHAISLLTFLGDVVEYIARSIQMQAIRRHTTYERISDTQLWFFPRDFETRVKKHLGQV